MIYLEYFKTPISKTIDTKVGVFLIWIEKAKCFNEFRYKCKQLSVKYNEQNYYIDAYKIPEIRIRSIEPIKLTCIYNSDGFAPYELEPVKETVIRIKSYESRYRGNMNRVKFELRNFERWLMMNACNIVIGD